MKTLVGLLVLVSATLSACNREYHVIAPIPRFTMSYAQAARAAGLDVTEAPGAEAAQEVVVKERRLPGVWLARNVIERTGMFKRDLRLRAIEIIFCPADPADYTQCRIGIAWSRRHHPFEGGGTRHSAGETD